MLNFENAVQWKYSSLWTENSKYRGHFSSHQEYFDVGFFFLSLTYQQLLLNLLEAFTSSVCNNHEKRKHAQNCAPYYSKQTRQFSRDVTRVSVLRPWLGTIRQATSGPWDSDKRQQKWRQTTWDVTNKDNRRYNSKISTGTRFPLQYAAKRKV